MCGFVASAGRMGDAGQRDAALQRLGHRGPDAKGQWQGEEGVWLGHCRLSIVDLSVDGNQPLTNEDNSLILVCNGEIYNAPALRQELQEAGHRFRSNSDNEVILHAYESWGEGCLSRLRGMFAFALWSVGEKKLWLVRDPLGMKPLYYALLGTALVAASESCGLLPFLAGKERPDPMAMGSVLTLGYLPAPQSIWQGVVKLAAGHALVWQGGEILVKRYWQPAATLSVEKEYHFDRWQQLFHQVVKDHLLADVPISLFLSAGLDSSALAVALAHLGHKLPAFTMDFVHSPRNEAPAAQVLADRLGFPHQGVTFTTEEMYGLLAASGGLDEPLGTSSTMLYLAMCKRAAAHGKVVLGGDGGDEVLGGYTWYRNLYPLPTGSLVVRKALAKMIQRPVPAVVRSWAAWAFARSSVLHRHAWRI
ncbi:MAG: asparagine synthase (glutamine-hydrolyzing), partial [Magnetococcales bacterium]|nr:asparagine synthase (glutamine-hydrolyzing) [Magnetococcales bacterium]